MNSNSYNNKISKEIIPSARKGIHHDCHTCSLKRLGGMGKYGLNNKTRNVNTNLSPRQNTSQGVDEVDCINRHYGEPSCLKANLTKISKNSIKSIRPTYNNESDDDETSQEYDDLDTKRHNSPENTRINNSNTSNSEQWSPQNLQNNQSIFQKECLANNNGFQWKHFLIVPVVAIIICSVYNYNILKNIFNENLNIYDEGKFFKDVVHLGEKYKVTDDSILQIQSGISTVFRREDTGCFIFTYNSGKTKFNNAQFNNFMNDISSAAARYLRNESDIRDHVIVDSSKLDMHSHGELIERYRPDVTNAGLMFVKDMDEIPAKLAMAFHYYCDEFNPLITRSAIFFTLDIARCPDQTISHYSIEKCLNSKWAAVPKANILPLLSRVVSIVVDVTNVF